MTKQCFTCGEVKPLNEFYKNNQNKDGKTSSCKECIKKYSKTRSKEISKYQKKYRQEHREELLEYFRKYGEKNGDKIRKQQGHISMYENKSCSSYLGIVTGERLCRHLFKDVEVMSNNHSGYDIICNRGKKIDVKTSCLKKTKYPQWAFTINKNTIADFFILIAFDNRINLNPLHIWMIPGNEVNDKLNIGISFSTIQKWDKWKQDINNAQLCCAEIKKDTHKCLNKNISR